MKLLLVAATYPEIAPFLQHYGLQELSFQQLDKCDVLITGVGMVATAFALGQYLDLKSYDWVLNVGIAGTFDDTIAIGELVEVATDQLIELGAEDHDSFITLDEMGLGRSTFNGASPKFANLTQCKGITVNTVHGREHSITQIKIKYQAQVESMEGAAVFYACENIGLPAIQVRAISNKVEPRCTANWQIPLAVSNLNTWLIALIEKL